MRNLNNFSLLTVLLGAMQVLMSASITRVPPRPVKSIPRPKYRSDWHHEQFEHLYSASIQPGAQSIFGYWCGPTLGGYCGSMSFDDINVNAVTHVPFAFAEITSDGTVSYTYDQGSVQQYNSSILIKQGVMAGLSVGGSATNADNCLNNIGNCVATLCATLEYYERLGSPFYFVDSDFEKPYMAQMTNLITFWRQFHEQCPGYLITMAPECAYLQLNCLPAYPGCTYCDTYVSVVNTLGPGDPDEGEEGDNIIYKFNLQSYNNGGCSINYQMGQVGFYNDVARTWMTPCENSEYLGLAAQPEILGIGFLGANADGVGYAEPAVVTQSLQVVNQNFNTNAGAMFWDTLTDYRNVEGRWVTSNAMAAAAPTGSAAPTPLPTSKPSMPTQMPSFLPSISPSIVPTTLSPSFRPTFTPTISLPPTWAPSGQPTGQPSSDPTAMPSIPSSSPTFQPTSEEAAAHMSGLVIALICMGCVAAGLILIYFGYLAYQKNAKKEEYQSLPTNDAPTKNSLRINIYGMFSACLSKENKAEAKARSTRISQHFNPGVEPLLSGRERRKEKKVSHACVIS